MGESGIGRYLSRLDLLVDTCDCTLILVLFLIEDMVEIVVDKNPNEWKLRMSKGTKKVSHVSLT